MKRCWLDSFLGVGPRSAGIALGRDLCDLGGGGSLWLKASMTGKASRAPLELCRGICFTTEEKHGKPQSV
jgi:hypothetical protein